MINIYDDVNNLVSNLKKHELTVNFKEIRKKLKEENEELFKKIEEFQKLNIEINTKNYIDISSITKERLACLTSNYNTIANLELIKKIKELKKDNINFKITYNNQNNTNENNEKYLLQILETLNLSDILKVDNLENDNTLLLTENTIPTIAKNLTQILLIYINNIQRVRKEKKRKEKKRKKRKQN